MIAAAADIAGARIGHRHRKAGGDRGIDRIAAALQHIGPDPRCPPFLRHHHPMRRRARLRQGRNDTQSGE